jgi:hypothetical protein
MKEALNTRCPNDRLEDSDCESEYERPTQAIAGGNIDPIKLKILLRTKFGAGSFELQVSATTNQHFCQLGIAAVNIKT